MLYVSGIYKLLSTAFDNNQTFVNTSTIYKELTTKMFTLFK